MNITCYPGTLGGTIAAIPSKSDAHRKLICAALSANGGMLPLRAPFCDDIAATICCLTELGAGFSQSADGLTVIPISRQSHAELDCGESGSTLRFLLPVAMAVCGDISVTGSGRLPERPIDTLVDAMSAHGVQFAQTKLPLSACGALTGGSYEIAGNISSQFLSGLLMALPLCAEDSEITLTTPLQSSAYVDMTLDTLRLFRIEIDVDADENGNPHYRIPGGQTYWMPEHLTIDGDWSNAAFWLAAGALQSTPVAVSGLDADSVQGDKAIAQILADAGANVTDEDGTFCVSCGTTDEINADMEEIPDLLPILAVRASLGNGVSHFTNAERLRLKESDRLAATAKLLYDLGGRVDENPDGLSVYGEQLAGGTVDGMNDHRLVMAAAIAALRCAQPVTILGAEAVNKSYPAFFEDYRALGGWCEESEVLPDGSVKNQAKTMIAELKATSDPTERNRIALEISDARCHAAAPALVGLIRENRHTNNIGTLVYALENLECADKIVELLPLAFHGDWETRHELMTLFAAKFPQMTADSQVRCREIFAREREQAEETIAQFERFI